MKFLGLTSLEIDILKLVNGSPGNQTYGHFGFLCGSLHGFKLPEPVFRRYFLKCCDRGMIRWQNEQQRFAHFKARYFEITSRGRNYIRDLQIHFGGDYSFYKYFTGNPSELDKHMKHRV